MPIAAKASRTKSNEPTRMSSVQPGLNELTAWTSQITAYQAAWQRECWEFVSQRLGRDAAFMQRLLSCQAPEQVMRAYADYYQQAFKDYQNEWATLAQLGTEMTVASVPAVPNGHDVLAPSELDMLGKLNA